MHHPHHHHHSHGHHHACIRRGEHDDGMGGGRGDGPRGGRVFGHGGLRFVLLQLIADKPSHGYELIKSIEDRLGGAYSPSPGTVYPTLTLMEEQGYLSVEEADAGGRKRYRITDAGQAFLADNRATVDAMLARMQGGVEATRRVVAHRRLAAFGPDRAVGAGRRQRERAGGLVGEEKFDVVVEAGAGEAFERTADERDAHQVRRDALHRLHREFAEAQRVAHALRRAVGEGGVVHV